MCDKISIFLLSLVLGFFCFSFCLKKNSSIRHWSMFDLQLILKFQSLLRAMFLLTKFNAYSPWEKWNFYFLNSYPQHKTTTKKFSFLHFFQYLCHSLHRNQVAILLFSSSALTIHSTTFLISENLQVLIFLLDFPRMYLQYCVLCSLFIPSKVGVPVFLDLNESRRKRNYKVGFFISIIIC